MKIVQLTQTNSKVVVTQAVKVLCAGGLVLYPTETVYGAGVDATNQAAVDKLLQYKSRREGKPLS
nr:Sua5/YciO/YrdC/YwlC family protein [Candidatus Woesebacteria bacterium]